MRRIHTLFITFSNRSIPSKFSFLPPFHFSINHSGFSKASPLHLPHPCFSNIVSRKGTNCKMTSSLSFAQYQNEPGIWKGTNPISGEMVSPKIWKTASQRSATVLNNCAGLGYIRRCQAGNGKRSWFWFGLFGLNQSRMPAWACRSSSEIPSAIL